MSAPLQLNEIIWEITNRCNKNCSYCGSKKILVKPDLPEEIIDYSSIALENIIGMKPETVVLSGGEPTLVTHLDDVIEQLHAADIEVRIITNGILLDRIQRNRQIDRIGVSINTIDDANNIDLNAVETELWIIMNVNRINFFDLPEIFNKLKQFKTITGYQIQLTNYNEQNLFDQYAITESGIQQLIETIVRYSKKYNFRYIFGDNLNPYIQCQAGIHSCGILYNDAVVPCLSYRSWKNSIESSIQGQISGRTSLRYIWENEFHPQRFNSKCQNCRSQFKYPPNLCCSDYIQSDSNKSDSNNLIIPEKVPGIKCPDDMPTVFVYGVGPSGTNPRW
jgi:MoaA/NifB/PqqE/SkfB family radical SAM enzyme